LKLIEAWGTGITKMKNEVAKYSEIELQLLEMGHAFQVQFRKKEVGTKQRTSTGQVPDKSPDKLSYKSLTSVESQEKPARFRSIWV